MSKDWQNLARLTPRSYQCGYCGLNVGPDRGYWGRHIVTGREEYIYICPTCGKPSYFAGTSQVPAVILGNPVENVPKEVEALYDEARACTGAQAYTAGVLACRKLLMNIAVQQGAEEGKRFLEYVEYLADKGYVPPNGKIWVDHIRKKGNEATHEIALMSKDDALDLITFIEMLLKFIYEFPSKIKSQ